MRPDTLLTLLPGAHQDIRGVEHATLVLIGGNYHAEALSIGKHAKVLCQVRCDVVVNDRLRPHQGALIGPQDGADVTATEIRLFIPHKAADLSIAAPQNELRRVIWNDLITYLKKKSQGEFVIKERERLRVA